MKKYLAAASVFLAACVLVALPAKPRGVLMGLGKGGSSGCTAATNFINREDGSQSNNTDMTTFICGGVTDGWFAKMDALYVFATNNTGNALLNTVSSSFTGTLSGSPTFTANNGFTGTDNSTTPFIDTGFNPTTATTPNFVQNSAHVSVWSNTSAAQAGAAIGLQSGSSVNATSLFPRFNGDGNAYFRINDSTASGAQGANADGKGQYIATRSGASVDTAYKNASSFSTPNATSSAPPNGNIYVLCLRDLGVGGCGTSTSSGYQIMMASIGGSLSATDVTNFCARAATYLNTVAGISKPC